MHSPAGSSSHNRENGLELNSLAEIKAPLSREIKGHIGNKAESGGERETSTAHTSSLRVH